MLLLNLPRSAKQFMLFALDLFIIPFAFILAAGFRLNRYEPLATASGERGLLVGMMLVGIIAVLSFGLPKIKLHAIETRSIGRIGMTALTLCLSEVVIGTFLGVDGALAIGPVYGSLFFLLALGSRILILFSLLAMRERTLMRVPVAIYGAGSAGMRIATLLNQSHDARPIVFVDDSPQMQGLIVSGLPVRSPHVLKSMVENGQIERVLLAIPSLSKPRREILIEELSELGCDIQVTPSLAELLRRNTPNSNLRSVSPDELLERNKIDLNNPRVARAYTDRVVMVTGAGGSIGSELCRQLIHCEPQKIVLFESSEYALYQIVQELEPVAKAAGIELAIRLGSVTDAVRVKQVLNAEKVEFILHAAAYKHVPLVEYNEAAAALNNVIGTRVVAEAAIEAGVRRFILVSTDKAVRPSSVMGATKRLAELVVQDLQGRNTETKMAIVRFGNVLGSSGSVLPLFQSQIANGGPVTVTHPEMRRFFMTIPEAARLVLLAGAFSQGEEIFVLDMGTPMKIVDIARRLIEMSGRRVKENGNDGDIEIQFTGIRPGEKLMEELVLDPKDLQPTRHEKILRAHEPRLSQLSVQAMLKRLQVAIADGDGKTVRTIISEYVVGFDAKKDAKVIPFEAQSISR